MRCTPILAFGLLLPTLLSAAPLPAPLPAPLRQVGTRARVEDVLRTQAGQYVVLLHTTQGPSRYLPIFMGETEALAIMLRLDRRAPPRPLTLNLLDTVMRAANIRVTDIVIDDCKGGVFLGKVRLRRAGKAWEMDARPSDAIGLAVAAHAPIHISQHVLDSAAVSSLDGLMAPEPAPGAPAASVYDDTL